MTLDLVVRAFEGGATAEEIVQDYPNLHLGDVYQVLGYYLNHAAEMSDYLERRAREEQEVLEAHREKWSPKGMRDRLLARRKGE